MSFFENFTEKAKMYANMAAEKAKDVAEVAADKAKDVKETAQLTMAIKTEQRELDKNYRAIGQWFASEYEGEIPDAIKDVVAAIEASRAKIEEMEAALAEKPCGDAESPSAVPLWRQRLPRTRSLPSPRSKFQILFPRCKTIPQPLAGGSLRFDTFQDTGSVIWRFSYAAELCLMCQ